MRSANEIPEFLPRASFGTSATVLARSTLQAWALVLVETKKLLIKGRLCMKKHLSKGDLPDGICCGGSKGSYTGSRSTIVSGLTKEEGQMGTPRDSGEARLHLLGYKQELRREFGFLTSTCSSLGLMAFSSGLTGFFAIAYMSGGPVSVVWGWIVVAIMNIVVALSMAEIVSEYPIAGGPYFWCLELLNNDPKYLLIGWCTGWMNVLGQFALTAFNALLLARHVATMWLLLNDHVFAPLETLLVYAIVLLLAGFVSTTSTRGMQRFALAAGVFLVCSGVVIVVVLPVVAPTHQTAAFVFTRFDTEDKAVTGVPNVAYLFLVGMLTAQGTFIGYEAPAQFAEETKRSDATVPRAIVVSVIANAVLGFCYLMAVLFSIQGVGVSLDGEANGYLVGQIFYDCFMARFGSGAGAVVLLAIPMITTFNATVLSLATNARMLWAFARDGGVPLSRVWSAVHGCTGTPVNAVWAMSALAFLLGLPMLYSLDVFQALASINSVGLYTSYAVPILLRMLRRGSFQAGPFQLGRWQLPVNLAAISWVVTSTVSFIIPCSYPVSFSIFNWTPVTVGAALLLVLAAWFVPRCGASHWYHGKASMLDDASMVGTGFSSGGTKEPVLDASGHMPKLTLVDLLEFTKEKEGTSLAGVGALPTAWAAGACPAAWTGQLCHIHASVLVNNYQALTSKNQPYTPHNKRSTDTGAI
ncbi:hypothetical protein WJX75_003543 [Coccomyxa subellipsoidea]|uniref:Amino acid transporter n=1 Tax=Coccomyxa subellipsoidea TaxID=248742 RepID=A0ABR2YCX9_9CHLO